MQYSLLSEVWDSQPKNNQHINFGDELYNINDNQKILKKNIIKKKENTPNKISHECNCYEKKIFGVLDKNTLILMLSITIILLLLKK